MNSNARLPRWIWPLRLFVYGIAVLLILGHHFVQGIVMLAVMGTAEVGGWFRRRSHGGREVVGQREPESSNSREVRRLRNALAIEAVLLGVLLAAGSFFSVRGPAFSAIIFLGLAGALLTLVIRTSQGLLTVRRLLAVAGADSRFVTGKRAGWQGLLQRPLVLGVDSGSLGVYAGGVWSFEALWKCRVEEAEVEVTKVLPGTVAVHVGGPEISLDIGAIEIGTWQALSETSKLDDASRNARSASP